MNMLTIVIISFLVLETMNVLTLYFAPGSKLGNGIGVFKAWEGSKQYPEIHDFVKYLVNWVAGTKLIFIFLLIVILFSGDENTLLLTAVALIASILSFYWRLFPLIRKMDRESQIEPKNYSTGLGLMITGFIVIFLIATLVSIF